MGKNDTKDAIAEAAGFSMPVAKDTSLRLCSLIASIGIIAWGHTGARVEGTAGARPSRTQAAYAAPPGERVIACSGEEWRATADEDGHYSFAAAL
jgi:hypothetical protein